MTSSPGDAADEQAVQATLLALEQALERLQEAAARLETLLLDDPEYPLQEAVKEELEEQVRSLLRELEVLAPPSSPPTPPDPQAN